MDTYARLALLPHLRQKTKVTKLMIKTSKYHFKVTDNGPELTIATLKIFRARLYDNRRKLPKLTKDIDEEIYRVNQQIEEAKELGVAE